MAEHNHNRCIVCGSEDTPIVFDISDHFLSKQIFSISECKNCGFRFTSNPPNEKSVGEYYKAEAYISHSDSRQGFIGRAYHQVRSIMLKKKYDILRNSSAGKNLLDVGSGTGYFAGFMKKRGYSVIGVEVSDQAAKKSRKKFGIDVKTPAELLKGEVKGPFDFITLWHVLEHLYQPERYMEKFKELLNDSGHLIIALPNFKGFEAKKYGSYWAGYDVPRHLWHFHPGAIETFASHHGFSLEDKKDMPFDPFYNSLLSEKYLGHKLGIIRAGFVGFRAMLQGKRDVNQASSVIYIFKKSRVK